MRRITKSQKKVNADVKRLRAIRSGVLNLLLYISGQAAGNGDTAKVKETDNLFFDVFGMPLISPSLEGLYKELQEECNESIEGLHEC